MYSKIKIYQMGLINYKIHSVYINRDSVKQYSNKYFMYMINNIIDHWILLLVYCVNVWSTIQLFKKENPKHGSFPNVISI